MRRVLFDLQQTESHEKLNISVVYSIIIQPASLSTFKCLSFLFSVASLDARMKWEVNSKMWVCSKKIQR